MSEAAQTPEPTGGGSWSRRTLGELLGAEIRATLSTSSWWKLLVAASVLCILAHGLILLVPVMLMSVTLVWIMASTVGFIAAKFAVVYGAIRATGESRHRTIDISHRTTPGPGQLLVAKLIVAAAVGASYALACTLAVLLFWSLLGAAPGLADLGGLLALSAVTMLVLALWSALGVGIGMLIGHRTIAIAVLLTYLLIEPIIALSGPIGRNGFRFPIGDYLPSGSATATLSSVARELPGGATYHTSPMPWWLTLLLFTGYTAVAVLAGLVASRRRSLISGSEQAGER